MDKHILKTYFSACGLRNVLGVVIGLGLFCSAMIANNIWLSIWTDDAAKPHPEDKVTLRLSVYGSLGAALSESDFTLIFYEDMNSKIGGKEPCRKAVNSE